ncbi:MAG TPA: matrixin family metalloprotease [Candidatus Eisenbacteria bacterium]|nr:matrixin family metalloprotease [Candidatus Eisenbacteria bacterium]
MNKRKTAGALVAAAVILAGGLVSEAFAFRMIQNTGVGRFSSGALVTCSNSGGFVHWTNANIPFRHNTANQGSGKGTALSGAAAAWTGVSGANHNVTIAGTTTAGFVTDGINTLRWANGSGCTGSCLALTALVLASGQRITETDVTFNNAVTWTTNGNNYDTQAVATHELGHCMGIHHTNLTSTSPRPTMYAYYFGSSGRSLETDDRSALQCAQNRYPPAAAQFAAQPAVLEEGLTTGTRTAIALAARPREGGALLRFALPEAADVRLDVYDVAGRHLTTLVSGFRPAGEHEVAWNGSSGTGPVPSGVYFARLQGGGQQARATVILAE